MFNWLATEEAFLACLFATLVSYVLMHAGRRAYRVTWSLNRAGEWLDSACKLLWPTHAVVAFVSLVLNVIKWAKHV